MYRLLQSLVGLCALLYPNTHKLADTHTKIATLRYQLTMCRNVSTPLRQQKLTLLNELQREYRSSNLRYE